MATVPEHSRREKSLTIEHRTQNGEVRAAWCPIIELRQDLVHAGRREDLIGLFDDEFIETQEAVGLTVIGQFRDLDNPDSFLWLRGFPGMDSRPAALSAFYDGPVWKAHRDRANATMIDSDNVLLLRPARPGSGFAEVARPGSGTFDPDPPSDILVGTIYYLEEPAEVAFLDFFESEVVPTLREAGASIDAYYTSEPGPNNFPRLPVRENETVLVWFAAFPAARAYQRFLVEFQSSTSGRRRTSVLLAGFLRAEPEIHRLAPTARSRLPQRSQRDARLMGRRGPRIG